MLTYTTLDGDVLDLSDLSDPERAFFDRVLAAYRDNVEYEEMRALNDGEDNPALDPDPDRRITPAVQAHPLYRATSDLEDRAGIKQDMIAPEPSDDLDRDPVADEWLPAARAAEMKGVTLPGLHKAIERGAVIAHRAKPGGVRLVVSKNSLDRWTPNRVRQAARKAVPVAQATRSSHASRVARTS